MPDMYVLVSISQYANLSMHCPTHPSLFSQPFLSFTEVKPVDIWKNSEIDVSLEYTLHGNQVLSEYSVLFEAVLHVAIIVCASSLTRNATQLA